MISFDQTTLQEGRQGEGRINMTVASPIYAPGNNIY
jgi:hypothetical protein